MMEMDDSLLERLANMIVMSNTGGSNQQSKNLPSNKSVAPLGADELLQKKPRVTRVTPKSRPKRMNQRRIPN